MKVIIYFFFAGKRLFQLTSKTGILDLKFFRNRDISTPVFPFSNILGIP